MGWHGNLHFKHSNSLAIILYQDSFEIASPLGSGWRKHKVLGVYLTLANIQPHSRAGIDQMQLVMLCLEKDYKCLGQDMLFESLIQDLKEIESHKLTLPDGRLYKVTVYAIA